MSVIYEPSGKAREYSPLACNIATGCSHRCKYCYCPSIMHKTLDTWSQAPTLRKDIERLFAKEAAQRRGCKDEILFCFMCDCYQNEACSATMGALLQVCEREKLNPQILTKAGFRASRHFPILARNGWKFGSTVCFLSESLRENWEPGAPSIDSRIEAIRQAHAMGIYTWVSIEPVVDAGEAIGVMNLLRGMVDFWKVGKLNHFPAEERKIDWREFYLGAKEALAGEDVYWKKDLLEAAK